MSLLDDLKNLLNRHKQQLATEVNQGAMHLLDEHLAQLESVVSAGEAKAEAEVHKVLADLYGRLNAGAALPDETPAPEPTPAPPVETEPAPVAEPAPVEAPADPAPAEA